MSYRLSDWAWSVADLTPTQKLVLLALAQCCNGKPGNTVCWPSQARLRAMTALSERSVRYALRDLEARCLIASEPGRGKTSTRYRLTVQDSPNGCLDLPDPTADARPRGARDAAPEGQQVPGSGPAEGQEMPLRGATVAGRGATVAAGTSKEQVREQGAQRELLDPASRVRAREPAAGTALSQPPGPRWRMIAAAVRPDLPDAAAVRAKFEAYHRGATFDDEAAAERAWELWLLREQTSACRSRFRRYTEPLRTVPGAFLTGRPLASADLCAPDEVIRD